MCWAATGRGACAPAHGQAPPAPRPAPPTTMHTRPGLTSRAAGSQKRRRARESSAAWRPGRCCWRSARAPLQPARPPAWRAGARRAARRCRPRRALGSARGGRGAAAAAAAGAPARAALPVQRAQARLPALAWPVWPVGGAATLRRRCGAADLGALAPAALAAPGRLACLLADVPVGAWITVAFLSARARQALGRCCPGAGSMGDSSRAFAEARARALHLLPQAARVIVAGPWDEARPALGAARTGRRAAGCWERSAAHAGGRACPGRQARHAVQAWADSGGSRLA